MIVSSTGFNWGQMSYCSVVLDISMAPIWCGTISRIKFALIWFVSGVDDMLENICCIIWSTLRWYRHKSWLQFLRIPQAH